MSEEGTDNRGTTGDLLPGLTLKNAASSIAVARARLELRQSVGRALRAAIKHILEAQEKLEGSGTIADLRLDLLEAVRFIGAVESALKGSEPEARPEVDPTTGIDATVVLEPDSPQVPPPQRQVLSALAGAPTSNEGTASGPSAQRGVTPPPEPAPSHAAASETDTPAPQHAPGGPVKSLNRRSFARLAAIYPIQIQAPYEGLSNSDVTQLPISGMTVNLSRGGMLAQIDQGVLRPGRYLIRFLGAGHNLRPEIMWGEVRRSRAADAGWEVGIEFDGPLELLRP